MKSVKSDSEVWDYLHFLCLFLLKQIFLTLILWLVELSNHTEMLTNQNWFYNDMITFFIWVIKCDLSLDSPV